MNLRIIDDTLFRLMAKNKKVCQEILSTLLDMPELIVIRSDAQYTITSLHREITIDAFYNEKFPAISDSINYYKRTKGGFNKMCKAVEEYAKSVAESATAEVSKKLEEANKKAEDTIRNLLSAGKLSIEEIADAVSEPVGKIEAIAEEMNSKKA